ncbi:hypothetical protein HaLaN_02838, partial [Haematococcus lacustris]
MEPTSGGHASGLS